MESDQNTGDRSEQANNDSLVSPNSGADRPALQLVQGVVSPTLQQNIGGSLNEVEPKDNIGDEKHPLVVRVIKDDDLNSFEKKTVRIAKWGVGVAAVSLLAAIGAGVAVYLQFGEMAKQTGILAASFEKQKQDSTQSSHNTAKQLGILGDQLIEQQKGTRAITGQMRQDQRPWLRVEFVPTPGASNDPTKPKSTATFATGQPINVPVRIRNTGKTPALDITANFIIELATIDGALPFPPEPGVERRVHKNRPESTEPPKPPTQTEAVVSHIETGAIFPDSFTEASIVRGALENGKEIASPLTVPEALDMISGKVLIYIIGRIEYFDEFGTFHWTDFCHPVSDALENRLCAKYSAVDRSQ